MSNREETSTNSNRIIEFKCSDNVSVKIEASLLEKFPWFTALINFEKDKDVFEYDNISGENFKKIVKWMKYEGSGEMPALIDPDTNSLRELTSKEKSFSEELTDEQLVELMIDADFFAMKNLLEILTSVAALRIVTYPIERIRMMFHITDSGYTVQEEQKLASEIQWALKFQK